MSTLLNAAAAILTIGALVLTVLAALAWHRSRAGRLALLAGGFGLFAAAGLSTSAGLFSNASLQGMLTVQTTLTAAGVFVVYLAAVKK